MCPVSVLEILGSTCVCDTGTINGEVVLVKCSSIPKVDIFVEPSRQSGPKMTSIDCISMERQVPYNEYLSEIFENLDVDYQMLIISGQY